MIAPTLSITDLVRRHYVPNHDLDPGSIRHLELNCDLFERWAAENRQSISIDANHRDAIVGWINHLLARKLAPRTVRTKRGDVLSILRWAYDEGFTEHWPARVKKIKVPKRIPTSWFPEEMRQIVTAARGLPGRFPWGAKRSDTLVATILVVYDSCCRIGAVMQADRAQLVGTNIVFRAEDQKHFCDQHSVMRDKTLEVLDRFSHDRKKLIPWEFDQGDSSTLWHRDGRRSTRNYATLNTWLRRCLLIAELPHARRDLWHKIRRTVYTQTWITAGPEAAMRMAGHTNLKMGESYLDTTKIPHPHAAQVLPCIAAGALVPRDPQRRLFE